MRLWRLKNRARIRETYRVYNRLYARRRRNTSSRKRLQGGFLGTSGEGRRYEKLALDFLNGSVDKNLETFQNGWDIEWNGMLIDVKMRHLNPRGGYLFTRKPTCAATHFLCFCVKDKEVRWIFLFPSKIFKWGKWVGDARIGKNVKYLFNMVPSKL